MKLSKEEQRILGDTQFLTLKHRINEKVISYFAEIERALHQQINHTTFDWPEGTFLKAGKISKGEQYRSLPYFILDYPRLFTQKEIFAFRTMLWWGNHLSCTLQLSGSVLDTHKTTLVKNLLEAEDIYFCVNNQPWDYHFDEDNYLPIREISEYQINNHISQNGFVKISNFIALDNWEDFKSFTLKTFARFLQYVS